ncbi:MAG: cytochrome c biogenesis protein CcsA [Ignavibacteriales bacterium]|nr:cytochrome c biogenesis protein CcsA [Ignavibacteriales bacterium]
MTIGIVGGILVKLSFFAALAAAFFYYRISRSGMTHLTAFARNSYHLATVSLMSAAAILLYLVLSHQFQFAYVWNYSSTDLPLPLLISTFYAGQEGSFTLWALYTALIGVFLMHYAMSKEYEPEVMSIYSLILSFLLLMLIVKNPFEFIWDRFPNDLIQTGPVPPGVANIVVLDAAKSVWARYPAEGKGLNPLLQNYWMVIHPQILFVGFSAMAVPYAHAIAGLLKKDYNSWIRVATPWLVFGGMVLGTGVIMGGYWAYETLGWGGFWGWDPVENSSLVPWLLCVAGIHTTLVQRKNGAYVKTNFALSILTFVAVLYSTFLTRSGVLGETSVHSFVDPGMWVYWLLLGWMIVFAALGFGLLFIRSRAMPVKPVEHSIFSREFALFLGAFALTFVAIFVTIGTSSPIITTLMKGKASAVEMSYYVKTNLPLGIAIAFLSGLGQLLWWKHSQEKSVLRSTLPSIVIAGATTLLMAVFATEEVMILIFAFCSVFSLAANTQVGYGIYRGNPKFIGGSVAHVGVALLCLGFITSERYDDTKTVSLERNKPVEALGYTMTYVGYAPIDRERFGFNVELEKNGTRHTVTPTMYFSEFTRGLMRHPDLLNFLSRDLYLAPLSLEEEQKGDLKSVELQKGAEARVGELTVTFVDFSDVDRMAMIESREFTIKAKLSVKEGTGKPRAVTVSIRGSQRGMEPEVVLYRDHRDRGYEFLLSRILPNREDPALSTIVLDVKLPEDPAIARRGETLVVEASIKPMINLVWMGTVTLVIGFFLTILRRVSEARERTRWERG